jgi:hypothetical protein
VGDLKYPSAKHLSLTIRISVNSSIILPLYASVTRYFTQLAIETFSVDNSALKDLQLKGVFQLDPDSPCNVVLNRYVLHSGLFCRIPQRITSMLIEGRLKEIEISIVTAGNYSTTIPDNVFELKHEVNCQKQHRLAIVTSIKNEAGDLEEWIAYHRIMGVSHFRIYLQESSTDIAEVQRIVAQYPTELVQLIVSHDWTPENNGQTSLMNAGLNSLRDYVDYILFCDTDEFVWFSRYGYTLHDLLDDHMSDNRVAVYFKNMLFGTSFLEHQSSLVIEDFIYRAKYVALAQPPDIWLPRTKLIVNTKNIVALTIHNEIQGS